MTSPTLEITPHPVWGAVSNAEPPAQLVDERDGLVGFNPTTAAAFRRATSSDYFGWLEHIRSAAACTRPIRLVGAVDVVHAGTGQRLGGTDTATMPDGLIYKACGTRRASICPACARTYQYDAYQLLRAGLSGGKGVPDTVATHPAVFLTLTAPSFGLVHTRVVKRHTCRDKQRCQCRAEPCHARTGPTAPGLCDHGQPAVCFARHERDDPWLGQPFCLDCYDHDAQAVFNTFAGLLWARTKQNIQRELAHLAKLRGISATIVYSANGKPRTVAPVQAVHGKVAEMQRRGVVHFHAILRLDGVPEDSDTVVPPPAGITVDDLHATVRIAASRTKVTTPAHPDQLAGWTLAWGGQVDVATIELTGKDEITDAKVAGYLAKYATKATEVTGHSSGRLDATNIGEYADPDGDHTARLIDACWRLGRPTHALVPLSARPTISRPAIVLGARWSCPECGAHTRLRHCPDCGPKAQARVDTQPAGSHEPNPYAALRRWAHLLGFGGHFLSKGRRYSTTFAALRAARAAYRRDNDQHSNEHASPTGPATNEHDDQDQEDTVLLIGSLSYAGTGWHTSGDALLAATAANLARSRRATAREELAHELGTAPSTSASTSKPPEPLTPQRWSPSVWTDDSPTTYLPALSRALDPVAPRPVTCRGPDA